MLDVLKPEKTLPEQAADKIMHLIMDEKLNPGDKLPNEFELCHLLGVSRTTVREAVKILVSKNLVEIQRGRGTFVSEKLGVADDPLGLALIENKKKLVADSLHVRYMLEPAIAEIAAQTATEQDIAELEEIAARIEAKIKAGENHGEEDSQFHSKIAYSTKNIILSKMIPVVTQTITLFVSSTKRLLLKETIDTHREIINAIKDRDSARARKWMEKHLDMNRDQLQKM